ncbi:MAG TPA: rhodanese-like domain-containing protein [Aquimonas sp.]|jgi:rhodanese-related sulfurtransferase|nr:rhodanese-like domain-containing protein [Xanthomonadales bacterium]HRD72569.1 rhodanese-like domain-containing protein [Aquimonas sp.]HRF53155.1 rhodanese-like domain-containing protein [Aquimonas sp.]
MRLILFTLLLCSMPPASLLADEPEAAVLDAMSGYMDFAEYGGSLIWPAQIPAEDWSKILLIDARDAAQFDKEHIPGAIHIEWRQVLARRDEIPKDRMVVIYCNSGSLSAQAVFALRVLGWENVKVLQDGMQGWKRLSLDAPVSH